MKALLISFAFLVSTAAHAATISFDFISSLIYTTPGQTVVFRGTITNTGPGVAYINGDTLTFPLSVNDLPFFLNAPTSLVPGGTSTADWLIVPVPSATPVGLYQGTFSILGGDTPNNVFSSLGTRPFAVQVVPEPASLILIGSGLVLALGVRQRIGFRRG